MHEHRMLLAEVQVHNGHGFLTEHPSARSWKTTSFHSSASIGSVAEFDQCVVGLINKAGISMKKRTRLWKNVSEIHSSFDAIFSDGGHPHHFLGEVRVERNLPSLHQGTP